MARWPYLSAAYSVVYVLGNFIIFIRKYSFVKWRRINYRWTYQVIKKGHKKQYEEEDIPSPLPEDQAEKLGDKLEQ